MINPRTTPNASHNIPRDTPHDPPKPRPPSLLSLPRELRDQIYTLALHHPTGLFHHRLTPTKSSLSPSPTNPTSINTLKLVSHQLHLETAGLELVSNTLIFPTPEPPTHQSSCQAFLHFFDAQLSPRWRGALRRVELRGGFADAPLVYKAWTPNLHRVVWLLPAYPRLAIYLVLDGGVANPEWLFLRAFFVAGARLGSVVPEGGVGGMRDSLIASVYMKMGRGRLEADAEAEAGAEAEGLGACVRGSELRVVPGGVLDEERFWGGLVDGERVKMMLGGGVEGCGRVRDSWVEVAGGCV